MLHYIIVPEIGEIMVTDGVQDLASFYFVQNGVGDFDIFDSDAPNDMPVATKPYLIDVYEWVMDIDPSSFQEVDHA